MNFIVLEYSAHKSRSRDRLEKYQNITPIEKGNLFYSKHLFVPYNHKCLKLSFLAENHESENSRNMSQSLRGSASMKTNKEANF